MTEMVKLFITSKNSGPSYFSDSISILFMGTEIDEAIKFVPEDFQKYEIKEEKELEHLTFYGIGQYSPFPLSSSVKLEKLYFADGWWFSVMSVEMAITKKEN